MILSTPRGLGGVGLTLTHANHVVHFVQVGGTQRLKINALGRVVRNRPEHGDVEVHIPICHCFRKKLLHSTRNLHAPLGEGKRRSNARRIAPSPTRRKADRNELFSRYCRVTSAEDGGLPEHLPPRAEQKNNLEPLTPSIHYEKTNRKNRPPSLGHFSPSEASSITYGPDRRRSSWHNSLESNTSATTPLVNYCFQSGENRLP